MNSNDFTDSAMEAIKTLQEAEATIVKRDHELQAWHDRLKTREAELDDREKTIANRGQAVLEYQKLAASRKAEIEVLKDSVKQENKLRQIANGDASVLRATVVRLETEMARLISEKKSGG